MGFGTCDGDIEQTAFFLHLTRIARHHVTGEKPLFQTHYKHRTELQALGGMNGHQRHFMFVIPLVTIHITHQ